MAFKMQRCAAPAGSRCKVSGPVAAQLPRGALVVRACSHDDASSSQTSTAPQLNRRTVLGASVAVGASALVPAVLPQAARAGKVVSSDWEIVDLPVDKGVVLLDIAFTGDNPNHGFLLGTRQTLLETFDGGKSWAPRDIEAARDEGFNYRFNSISFNGPEGWIVGKPAILLHTTDGGANWERVPLSAKLPGTPILITALKNKGEAEMTTDQGAIYVTDNAAYTWTAAVQETVDATLNRTVSSGISGASYYEGYFSNVSRNETGEYVAVSSRGNFFMTWEAGQTYWQPHNRPAARRVQNMGWKPNGSLWLTTRGGDLLVANDTGFTEDFEPTKFNSRGFGILDVGFKDEKTAFACGGSGSLYRSDDGGQSWKRDKGGDEVPANLYEIKFFKNGQGFVLGNDAVLLRYIGGGSSPAGANSA